MPVAALLLTGGKSRRMGQDKATLSGPDGRPLAKRTASLLAAVAHLVVEVGPGFSELASVTDAWPEAGPLAATASGALALRAAGWEGPALVVATDLPGLNEPLLRWLADHPYPGNVVPLVEGSPQWLCARYDGATLAGSVGLVESGRRRMAALAEGWSTHRAGPDEWSAVAAGGSMLDVDPPEDLAAF
jgi:molybdopterin-guanine dinucleotide biosynthesis protein A